MYVYSSIPIRRTTWNLCNFYIPLTWCAWSCAKIKCNSGTITTTSSNVNINWNELVLFSLILPKAKKACRQSTELFNTYCVVLYFDHTKLELIVLLSPKVDCRKNSSWFLTNITLVISKNFNHSFLTVTVKESVQVLQPAAASVSVTGPSLVDVVPSIVNVSKSNLNLHISEMRS